MQIKRIAAGLLCAGLCLSATTACSGNGDASGSSQATQDSAVVSAKTKAVQLHKLTVRAPKDISEMTAVFLNTSTGKTANVKMEQTGGNNNEKNSVFSCEADANAYNMVRVKYGETESMDVALAALSAAGI